MPEQANKYDLPYVPSMRYVEKNLKPESELKVYDFVALRLAAKHAIEQGVLSKELADKMLPMAMVEGRSGTKIGGFGLNDPKFYAKPETIDRFRKMGLSVFDTTAETMKDRAKGGPIYSDTPASDMIIATIPGKQGKFLMMNDDTDIMANPSPMRQARIMAAVLAEKASLKGANTVDDAVKLFNGRGKSTQTTSPSMYGMSGMPTRGQVIPADTEVYLKKVKEAESMLSHPANAPLQQFLQETGVD